MPSLCRFKLSLNTYTTSFTCLYGIEGQLKRPCTDHLLHIFPELPVIPYEFVPTRHLKRHINHIRHGFCYEGQVLYFMDSSHSVIGLLKKKTVWYIMCRIIREHSRVRPIPHIGEKLPNVNSRYDLSMDYDLD